MDAITINTIVGITGIIVAIIGIVVGIIGGISLHKASFKAKIKASDNSNVNYVNYNGMTYPDVVVAVNEHMKQYSTTMGSIKELEEVLNQNKQYAIPLVWVGTQDEYDQINSEHKIYNGVMYLVVE